MTDAESAQRGYLLTGDSSYLQPYTEAVANVEARAGSGSRCLWRQ